jgi:hypothetical protein
MKPERHWDWYDMQIARCLKRGLEQGAVPANFPEHEPGDADF